MKVHMTKIYGVARTADLSQAKTLKEAKKLGFNELGLYAYPCEIDSDEALDARLDGILASIQFGDIVFMQSPSWNLLRYDLRLVQKLKAYGTVKIVMFVHDVIPLLFNSGEDNLRAMIEIYNYADLIILPSLATYELLCEKGLHVKKYLIQKVWDYPIDFELNYPEWKNEIIFAGEPSRFPFVHDWNYETPLVYYSSEVVNSEGKNVIHRGYKKEAVLLTELSQGGYGLVWPSQSDNNNYERLQPYKLGNYLAAGIPVIIKKGLASEEFVTKNRLGFVVETLEEANEIVRNTSKEEYDHMVKHISEFNFLIKDGWFTKKLLTDAVNYLLDDTFKS